MTQGVICLILGVIAVATFWMKGKQWPTFITAGLFGMYAGSTVWGGTIMHGVTSVFTALAGAMS